MAKQVVVTMIDDIDGTDGAETVEFSIEGQAFEVDLSEKNAGKLRKALRPYTSRARQLGPSRRPRSRITVPPVGQSRSALIRGWAASEGLTVPARGRIPQPVVTAFDATHASVTQTSGVVAKP